MEDVEGYSSLPAELKQELRSLLAATSDPTLALRHATPTQQDSTAQPAEAEVPTHYIRTHTFFQPCTCGIHSLVFVYTSLSTLL